MRVALALLVLLLPGCAGAELAAGPPERAEVRTVQLGPLGAMPGEEADRAARALGDKLTAGLAAILPSDPMEEDAQLFRRRDGSGAVWSISPYNALDLSGVSWGDGGRAMLITDRHVVSSAHVRPGPGDEITFYTRGGWPVRRTVVAQERLQRAEGGPDLDTKVGLLDEPVPAGVAVYPLPSVAPAVMRALAREQVPVLVTYNRRSATVGTLGSTFSDGQRVVYALGSRRLGLPERLGHQARSGDSGHPSFYVLGDQLVLASQFHTAAGAGAGVSYASAAVRRELQAAIERLDAGGGEKAD